MTHRLPKWSLPAGFLILALLIAGCGSASTPTHPPALTKSGMEYIARSRIVIRPESSRHPDVRYPNGEVRSGAFVRPPNGKAQVPAPVGAYERHITQPGLTLIEEEEGFVSCPEYDPYGGVWDIGFGEAYISPNRPCESRSEAQTRLQEQIRDDYEWSIREIGGNGYPQRVFNALADFDYNEGPYIFQINPYLRGLLEAHRWYAASEDMLSFDIAGGQVLGDLYRRRLHEQEMMLGPEPYSPPPETPAQRHARLERELAGAQDKLVGLRRQKALLVADLIHAHCKPHERRHKCVIWVNQAYRDHVEGVRLDGVVVRLRRELG